MIEKNKIHNMDCLKGLKKIDDNTIDLVITDPPYGDNCGYGRGNKEIQNNENPLLNLQVLHELQRVLKNNKTIYNFTNWKHYPFLTEYVVRYTIFNIRMMIVLNKNNFGLGYGFRNQHELILVLEKGNPSYNENNFSNVMNFKMVAHHDFTHPHEKPKDMIRKLLLHSSGENDLVLDTFAGSGAVPVVCKEMKRDFIAFEIEEKWCDLGERRLKQNNLLNILGGENNG